MLFILFNLSNMTLTANSPYYGEYSRFSHILTRNPIMHGVMKRCENIHKDDDKEHIQLLIDIGSYVNQCKWFLEMTFEREEKIKNKKQFYLMLIDILNFELLQMMHVNLRENNSIFTHPNDNTIEEGSYFYTKSILLTIFDYCMRVANKKYTFDVDDEYYAVKMCVGLRKTNRISNIDNIHKMICQKILSIDLYDNQTRKNDLITEIVENKQ